jgi:hypothetical protein
MTKTFSAPVKRRLLFLVSFLLAGWFLAIAQTPIIRKALVERHTIILHSFDSLSSLSVGNGAFAFTTDITGLQSFPGNYVKGVPLGTQSEWGWHSFPNTGHYKFEEALKTYHFNGRDVTYAVQWDQPQRNRDAADYFRQNVHRLQLGNIGFEILKKDGTVAVVTDIKAIHQELNMWTGEIHSMFTVENEPVDVITYGHQQQDAIAVKVTSPLIQQGRIKIRIRFPYPTGQWSDAGNNWENTEKQFSSIITQKNNSAVLKHSLDTTEYFIGLQFPQGSTIKEKGAHYYLIQPPKSAGFSMSFRFDEKKNTSPVPSFAAVENNNKTQWKAFWMNGAAVDFSGSTDRRATELERRIILSQYLTKIQCAGSQPPQETGLTYNSWYGKPHLEMHWWHAIHFALWNRTELLEKTLAWYNKAAHYAYDIAKRQGYDGLRWQKVTDNIGRESPSSVGAMLIWQQPHFIYMAELCRRKHNDLTTINRYKDLVFATADFMSSFAYYDSAKERYILGKGVIPAQERFKPEETYNPTYELAYWYWGLQTAQKWREALHMGRNKKWDDVINKLSPLPVQDSLYLAAESAKDSYANPVYRTDHPSVLATFGMLPKLPVTDTGTLHRTFDWIWDNWTWKDTWGWDFPMVAMTATRLGLRDKAIDALLMPIKTNTYLPNGHNYQDERLTIYLPGNGGLLAAVAMMCAGYDGCKEINPGFPKDGKWKIKWEGFQQMP